MSPTGARHGRWRARAAHSSGSVGVDRRRTGSGVGGASWGLADLCVGLKTLNHERPHQEEQDPDHQVDEGYFPRSITLPGALLASWKASWAVTPQKPREMAPKSKVMAPNPL